MESDCETVAYISIEEMSNISQRDARLTPGRATNQNASLLQPFHLAS